MLEPNDGTSTAYRDHGNGLWGQEPMVEDRRVVLILRLITDALVPERLNEWDSEVRKSNAGQKAAVSYTAAIVILLILAVEGSPLHFTKGATLIQRRLTPHARHILGIPEGLTWTQCYHALQKAFTRLIALADPKPAKYGRKMTKAEAEAMIAARDADLCARNQVRLDWLCNQLLYATVAAHPQMLDGWEGNVTIDATAYSVQDKAGQTTRSLYASIEPDAAFYMRDARHEDTDDPKRARKWLFGYEIHLVAPAANTNPTPGTRQFVQPVIGISQCKPSERPAHFGLSAITSAFSNFSSYMRGGLVVADRGYFANSKAEDLALPVRALGMGIVTDYKKEQLSVVDGYAGADLIEGHFYCPAMPKPLQDVTANMREHTVDPELFVRRIDARHPYLLRRKAKPDKDGYTPMMCPAAGPNATVTCPLKPKDALRNSDKALLPIFTKNLPTHPDRICNQTSVVFPPTAGAKFRQDVRYATREWFRLYRAARNFIESTNAFLKNQGRLALSSGDRRVARGYAKQYFLVTTLIFAANLKRINTYLWEEANPKTAKQPRRRDQLNNFRWDPSTGRGKKPNGILDGHGPTEPFTDDLGELEKDTEL